MFMSLITQKPKLQNRGKIKMSTYVLVIIYMINGKALTAPEQSFSGKSAFLKCSEKALIVKKNVESLGGKILSAECVPQ